MAILDLRAGLFVWAILVAANGLLAAEPKPSPMFAGTVLPEPPLQHKAWTAPPTTLPASLVSAVDLLFQQGMADPRGCEYREIDVVVGDVWNGDGGIRKVHGWVLPRDASSTRRFAVCWNGLVYPTISVGARASLEADIDAMISLDAKERQEWQKHYPNSEFRQWFGVIREDLAISEKEMCRTKVCMLLRLGEARLVEAYWKQLNGPRNTASEKPNRDGQREPDEDPYLSLAHEWAWMAFDRAVCAHMRGDDVVALETAALLSRAQSKIESAAAGRHFKRPIAMDPKDMNRELPNAPYLSFLEPLPALLADEERRVKEGTVERVLDNPKKFPDKTKRIAAMVRDLEVVSGRQWMQPGGVWLGDDPVVKALEHEGTDAIEPLLNCLENDQRLTRSVQFGRDFGSYRELLPVQKAAYFILQKILQTETFGPDTDDYRQLAAQIRTYWSKSKGKSAAERWFDTLADDAAGPKRWVEAAQHIVDPVDIERLKGRVGIPRRQADEIPPMKGEALRAKQHPSVSELMAKRVPSVAAENDGWLFAQSSAADLALDLHQWDAAAAVPVLREQIKRCMRASDADRQGIPPEPTSAQSTQTTEQMARDVGRLTTALAESGDAEGARMYRAWVVHQTPATPDTNVAALLQPIWRFPDEPNLRAAAEELFNGPKSTWRCLPTAIQFLDWDRLMHSPIYGVPAFRRHVARNLNNAAQIGTVWVKDNMYEFETAHEHGSESGANMRDPLLPKPPGTKIAIRVCDWYASKIAALDGAPPFELYWPTANRDAAVAKLAAFLERWGDHFRYSALQHSLPRDFRDLDTAHLTFPRLNRPATDADVAATRAIFALHGGPVRVVSLPAWPAKAKWTTLKDFPIQYQGGTDSKTGATIDYDDFLNKGFIWQAEEVQVNGKWERYYGFVGAHEIAKVPAREIELLKRD